jgi:hypothetical protein
MASSPDPHLPDDLRSIEQRLRRQRLDASPLELDALKRRVLDRRAGHGSRRGPVGSRVIGVATAILLLVGAGGAVALSSLDSHPNVNGGAANKQYHPGHGCHKKHHRHRRKCERPPKAYTGPAYRVGKHAEKLTGRVVVYDHLRTKYYFVYGICPDMDHRVGIGHTRGSTHVSVTVTGLKLGKTYCYEVIATNSRGTGRGRIRRFHTPASNPGTIRHKVGHGQPGPSPQGKKRRHGHHPSKPAKSKKGFTG